MDGKSTVSSDEDLLRAIQIRNAQAWGFRKITMLILTGEADGDPAGFLAKAKVIVREAAEKGG